MKFSHIDWQCHPKSHRLRNKSLTPFELLIRVFGLTPLTLSAIAVAFHCLAEVEDKSLLLKKKYFRHGTQRI